MSANAASSRYGNFEVLARADGAAELLGGGSFGKTYKARHVFLDQIVALKVISEKFAHDPNAKERFLREARVVHGLRHAHIAQVLDFGEANGTLYYAMEYCEGGSLEELVQRDGPLDPATVLRLAGQLAEALDCSHQHGFLHRDVKPANVMLADRGSPPVLKLVDFGLVKPLVRGDEAMASLTLDGQNFFTPLFASPEQVLEEELDARSDLFSLGMTLWYLLKGAPPETGSTAVVVSKRLSADSYLPALPASLPPRLHSVLEKLLEKDKADRFASAAEVLTAIRSDGAAVPPDRNPAPAAPGSEEGDPAATLAFEPAPAAGRLSDKYRLVEKFARSPLGNIYRATRVGDGAPLSITVLDGSLREDPQRLERLRAVVAQAVRCPHPAISGVYGLEKFADAEALVREWNGGVSLRKLIDARGALPFAEALILLRQVAAGADFAAAARSPKVRLAPEEIYLQPAGDGVEFPDLAALLTAELRRWPPFRVRLTPILLEDEEAAHDISITLGEQTIGSLRTEFGSLLYGLVAGLPVKFAARADRDRYIAAAGLSEAGNRLLSACIADESSVGKDCASVLTSLQRTEGIDDAGDPIGTTSPALGTTGTGGAFGRLAVAAAPKLTPTAVPTPPTRQTATPPAAAIQNIPRTNPTVRPPEVTPMIAPLPTISPPAPPAGTGAGHDLPAPTDRSSPWVPVVIGLTVALAVLGAAAFLLLRPPSPPEKQTPSVRQTPPPTPQVAVVIPSPPNEPTATTTPATPPPATPTPAATPSTFTLNGGARFPTPASNSMAASSRPNTAAANSCSRGRPATPRPAVWSSRCRAINRCA